MKLFLVFLIFLCSLGSTSYAGFKISPVHTPAITIVTMGSSAPADTVKPRTHEHHQMFYPPAMNKLNKWHPLLSFLSGLIGIACDAAFVVLLIHALPIAWVFLGVGALLGVLAIYLGFNSPKNYHTNLVVLGCIMGFIAAIPLYPVLGVVQLFIGVIKFFKRKLRHKHKAS